MLDIIQTQNIISENHFEMVNCNESDNACPNENEENDKSS